MQGVVFMSQNPQQGSPPPNNTIVTVINMEEVSSEPNQTTKEKLIINNQSKNSNNNSNNHNSDSGIFSTTTTTDENMDLSFRSNSENCDDNVDFDNRSDFNNTPERKYECPICDTILTSQHEVTLHIRSHNNESNQEIQDNNERGYICRICSKVLSSSSSLDRHVLVHSGERPFHCKYCGDTFTTNGNMHRHMRTHNNNNKNDNNYESDGSSSDGSSNSSSNNIEYNNNKIDLKTNKRKLDIVYNHNTINNRKHCQEQDELLIKVNNNEQQTYKCPLCERSDFNSLIVLETHLEDNHPDYPSKCNQCNKIFQNNKLLNYHRLTYHENNSIPNKQVMGFKDLTFVDFSSEKFPHIARYECEKNIHKALSGLKFQCKLCQRAFPCTNSLEIHVKDCIAKSDSILRTDNFLLDKNRNISETEIRRNEFFARLDLQDNSPEKQSTTSSSSLAINFPQLAEVSNKLRQQLLTKSVPLDSNKDLADIQSIISLTTNGSILHQLQTKNNEITNNNLSHQIDDYDNNSIDNVSSKPDQEEEEEAQDLFTVEFRKMKLRGEFPCRLCTAVFPNLRALKGHNRSHVSSNTTGIYLCNMCPYSTGDKGAILRHMRSHNGDRPYECSVCNYAFTTKANCERHLRNRHAKTTREEVKQSLIYHPSEDPTNDDLNKLATREDIRKHRSVHSTGSNDSDFSSEKLSKGTEMNPLTDTLKHEIVLPNLPPFIDSSSKLTKEVSTFSNINDIIRNENIKSLKDHRTQNEHISPYLQPKFSFAPKKSNVSTPVSSKIQVKSLDVLKDNAYETQSDQESVEQDADEPINLVLDLSKKKPTEDTFSSKVNSNFDNIPEDLTKKFLPISQPSNPSEIFAQHLLKSSPKIDPATLYATQLALARSSFPAFANWPGFPLNPLLFQSLQPSIISQDTHDIKERLQRYQLCGGNMIADNFAERLKSIQQQTLRNSNFNGFKGGVDNGRSGNNEIGNNIYSVQSKKSEENKALNVDTNFNETLTKLQSPVHQSSKADMLQSPNSVKMVIKNGVLMPKQKQRRYRTERPFTCEHCSARFTLRSNMERHIKQQHPQFWSQRQRGNIGGGTPGRKSSHHGLVASSSTKTNYCDLSIPNYEITKPQEFDGQTKEHINEKLKFAILAQQLRANHNNICAITNTTASTTTTMTNSSITEIKKEINDDDDGALIIDENENKPEIKTEFPNQRNYINQNSFNERKRVLEENVKDTPSIKRIKSESKNEEDLVSISRLLDNASQQPFKEYFGKRETEESEVPIAAGEEDEEGLVASSSTSEGNVSGTDENRSEAENPTAPVKKKSAYSLAPNRVSCPFCSRKFPWTSSLRRHVLTHTGQKPFKCSVCPLLFTTKSNCDRHLLRKHGNSATTISNSDAINNNNNNNTNYLMRNVPERPFKCSSCPSSTFSTYSNLKKHISSKHSTNAQGDDIRAQGYEAGSSEDEKIPNTESKNDWENQITTRNNKSLNNNNNNNTNNNNGVGEVQNITVQNFDLPFKCHLCDGSFGERQDVIDHIQDKHIDEYKKLLSKNALDNSNNTTSLDDGHHDDEEHEVIRGKFPDYSNRKVVCAFCMRRFWSAEDLRRHMRTHTGERPFSCDICRRKFTLKHSMLRHRKKHNLETDFVNSDEDGNNGVTPSFDKFIKHEMNLNKNHNEKTDESDGNEGGDLISNLLGIRDRSFIDKVLTGSADDAAKLLGLKNGSKE